MTTALAKRKKTTDRPTLTELHERFGDLPAWRIRLHPYPATADDVEEIHAHEKRRFELIDGYLVEKTVGLEESVIAATIIGVLREFIKPRNLGVISGESGMMTVLPGLVYMPDVAFVSWKQFPRGVESTPAPEIHPNLAVEVLSVSNTAREMKEKRTNYFESGTEVVWIVDPVARTVAIYLPADPENPRILNEKEMLDGEPVLSGFSVSVAKIFEDLAP